MTRFHVNAEQTPPPPPPDSVDNDPVPEVEPKVPAPEDTPAVAKGKVNRKCFIPPPRRELMNPTMIASYPGSGAKLTWKLIRAVSGYMTSDDAVDLDGLSSSGTVIAIKTHYPARGSNSDLFAPYEDIPRSVLLIRNPFNAIPSFHSYIYEQSLKLTGHSVRAPVDKWIAWRNRHFDTELDFWVNHTRFWINHHPFEQRLILPYDSLIQPGPGPGELKKLRTFLENNGKVQMRTPEKDIECIWDYIVMKRDDQGTKVGSMRSGGPSVWPYTPEQIERMLNALGTLKQEFPGQLGDLMDMYTAKIKESVSEDATGVKD